MSDTAYYSPTYGRASSGFNLFVNVGPAGYDPAVHTYCIHCTHLCVVLPLNCLYFVLFARFSCIESGCKIGMHTIIHTLCHTWHTLHGFCSTEKICFYTVIRFLHGYLFPCFPPSTGILHSTGYVLFSIHTVPNSNAVTSSPYTAAVCSVFVPSLSLVLHCQRAPVRLPGYSSPVCFGRSLRLFKTTCPLHSSPALSPGSRFAVIALVSFHQIGKDFYL